MFSTDETIKILDAISRLISATAWPIVVLIGLKWFGSYIRDFLLNLGEGSLKVLGVEASGKRRAEVAAALATATFTKLEESSSREKGNRLEGKEIEHSLVDSLKNVNSILTPEILRLVEDKTLMWVDDEPENNKYEQAALEALGIRVWNVPSTEKALELFRYGSVADVIITDMARREDKQAGYDLISELRIRNVHKPVVLYTGNVTDEQSAEARARGFFGSTDNANDLMKMVVEAIKVPSAKK